MNLAFNLISPRFAPVNRYSNQVAELIKEKIVMARGHRNDKKSDNFSRLCVIWGSKSDPRADNAEHHFPIHDSVSYYFKPDEKVVGSHAGFTITEIEDVTEQYAQIMDVARYSGTIVFPDADQTRDFSKKAEKEGLQEVIQQFDDRSLVGFTRIDFNTFENLITHAKSHGGGICAFLTNAEPSEHSGTIIFDKAEDVNEFMDSVAGRGMQVLACDRIDESMTFEFNDLNDAELKVLSVMAQSCAGQLIQASRNRPAPR